MITDPAMRIRSPASPKTHTGAVVTGHTEHLGVSAHVFLCEECSTPGLVRESTTLPLHFTGGKWSMMSPGTRTPGLLGLLSSARALSPWLASPTPAPEGLALTKVFRRMLQDSSAGCWSAGEQQKLQELLSYTQCWRC